LTDYKSWARGLKKAGYATNPKYPQLLIRIIEENDLYRYDAPVRDGKPISIPKDPVSNEVVVTLEQTPAIRISENRIKYMVSDSEYRVEDLAEKLEMGAWQIYKYNDLERGSMIEEGELIYLQPKRNKHRNVREHTVQKGETLRDISQQYGVKIRKILKHSDLPKSYVPKEGDRLRLRR
jgi:LysM repeat protein